MSAGVSDATKLHFNATSRSQQSFTGWTLWVNVIIMSGEESTLKASYY
jgi:hypothetical protein